MVENANLVAQVATHMLKVGAVDVENDRNNAEQDVDVTVLVVEKQEKEDENSGVPADYQIRKQMEVIEQNREMFALTIINVKDNIVNQSLSVLFLRQFAVSKIPLSFI